MSGNNVPHDEDRIVTFDEVIAEANARLLDFMDMRNLRNRNSRAFSCPNKAEHEHGDKHPSAHLFQRDDGTWAWQCHKCGAGSDTIAMVCIVDNMPTSGPGFFKQTLPHVMDIFGIKGRLEKPNPILDIYERIANHIKPDPSFKRVPVEVQKEYSIGRLDYDTAVKLVKGMEGTTASGFTVNDNRVSSIMRNIFTNRIVFTIRSMNGTAISFAGRKPENSNDERPKWINGPNITGVFHKTRTLYGLDVAIKHLPYGTREIYIVEGYTDTIRLHMNGIKNAVGIMGGVITEEQAKILKKISCKRAIISLDNDPETSATDQNSLKTGLILNKVGIDVYVKQVPEVGHDPDSYIQEYGIEKFKDIEEIPFVKYVMYKMIPDKRNREQTIEYIRWITENYKSKLLIEDVLDELSKYTGYPYDSLREETDNMLLALSEKDNADIRAEIDTMADNVKGMPIQHALNYITDVLSKVSTQVGKKIVSAKQQVDEVKTIEKNLSMTGYEQLKTGFPRLDKMVKIPKGKGLFAVIAANPNVGKSVFMRQLTYNILIGHTDTSVIYLTIDDDKADVISALVSLSEKVPLSVVRYPRMVSKQLVLANKEKIERGYEWVSDMISSKRLAILDADNILNPYMLATYIDSLKRTTENHIVVMIDSIHSLIDLSLQNIKDPRVTAMVIGTAISQMSINTKSTIFAIAEFNRNRRIEQGYKPTLANISETVKLEYLAKVGITMHDPRMSDPATPWHWFSDDQQYGELPMIELIVEKNKTGPDKFKSIWLKFHPFFSSMTELSEEEELRIMSDNAKRKRGMRY